MSVAGIAPQSKVTNGPRGRAPFAWMACATSSLPLPDSPWIRTAAPLVATREMLAYSRCIAADAPRNPSSASRCSPSNRTMKRRNHARRARVGLLRLRDGGSA
jgi:hypothetical protein